MAVRIQFRRSTSTLWTAANPTLAQGELALELDTRKFKIGDGLTPWNNLPYNTIELVDLIDVNVTGIQDKQFLQYDQANNEFKFADAKKFDKYIVSGSTITIPKSEHGISFPSNVIVLNGDNEVSVEVRIEQTAGVNQGDITVLSNIPLNGHRIIIA